jgi:hypothetical protein
MRTTLVLDDSVFEKAKKKSSELGMTLSELTTTALRNFLFAKEDPRKGDACFKMATFGGNESMHQSPEELALLRDEGR